MLEGMHTTPRQAGCGQNNSGFSQKYVIKRTQDSVRILLLLATMHQRSELDASLQCAGLAALLEPRTGFKLPGSLAYAIEVVQIQQLEESRNICQPKSERSRDMGTLDLGGYGKDLGRCGKDAGGHAPDSFRVRLLV